MRILGLDISTKCGWGLLEQEGSGRPVLLDRGLIKAEKPVKHYLDGHGYPEGFRIAALEQARAIFQLVDMLHPDVVVVEETNLGRDRYVQKLLEWIHCLFLGLMESNFSTRDVKVIYLSSSQWRHALGLEMTKQDRRNNAKLSKAKKLAAEDGVQVDKAKLGIRGKINKKHLAVRWVNAEFGLNLKMKDNDEADAVCLGCAFLRNARQCDGS